MKEALDPLTGETFIKKRNNQVFANRENQISFNNLKAQEKRKALAQINKILDKNRQILKTVLGRDTEITKSLDFLLGAGFHFGMNTHTMKIREKKWSCVYDYAYRLVAENKFKIIYLKS
jgi:hypothetical protein